ncbi:MAG TPA: IS110 family transposase [Pseudomonadota bacterium]|jgi:transposase|nr:IS110 family transposase [Pseudomonadota bacterium]
MDLLHARCAGLDVHKESVVACVRIVEDKEVKRVVRTFGTTTERLFELAEFLAEHGVTHVAMEATGVYWRPVWHILEPEGFQMVLGNAAHIRNVPGRKSDTNDAMWLADLMAHGLIRPSFVPPTPVEQLRMLTRTRKQLVREAAQHTQRIHKVLEDCNLKLTSVVTNVMGKTGRAILEALVQGQTDPEKLAELAAGSLRTKRAELVEALRGRVTAHHRFVLQLHLGLYDSVHRAVASIDQQVEDQLTPFRQAADLLETMPGVGRTAAEVILAEIGLDMERFPTAGHLRSWAGLCPRMDESAGKKRCTRIRKGAPWLKTTLVQAAWAAVRTKNSYYKSLYGSIKRSSGSANKAIVAVAAAMITSAYYMLKRGEPYRELGADYRDHRDKARVANRLIRRVQALGFQVQLMPQAA